MHSSRLALAGCLLVALLAVFAFSGLAAAAAQAVEAPRWSIGGVDLAEGKTHFISAKAYSSAIKLVTELITLECGAVKLKEGSLLGSSAGNPGKGNGVLEFSTCTVKGKSIEKCKVPEPLVTTPIKSELVESEGAEPANKKGSLLETVRELVRCVVSGGGAGTRGARRRVG